MDAFTSTSMSRKAATTQARAAWKAFQDLDNGPSDRDPHDDRIELWDKTRGEGSTIVTDAGGLLSRSYVQYTGGPLEGSMTCVSFPRSFVPFARTHVTRLQCSREGVYTGSQLATDKDSGQLSFQEISQKKAYQLYGKLLDKTCERVTLGELVNG